MRTKLIVAVVGLALLSFSAVQSFTAPPTPVAGEPQEKSNEPNLYMRRKLRFSQEIFVGIARADLPAVAAASRQMNALNWFEEITRGDDEEYQRHLKSYQVAGKKLQKKADAKDLDGATLAFMELTLSCVNCHKNVREHDATKLDAKTPSDGKSP